MTYLLDTNICIYVIRKKPAMVIRRMRSKPAGEIAISAITLAELEYGIARSQYPDRNRVALLAFLVPFAVLEFDAKACSDYGPIGASLEAKGKPVGPMDLLLAAQARSRGLILVTNNEREFQRIDGLEVENWTRS